MSDADADVDYRWPVRVYYEDTDAGGLVYHANYLRYLERARTEWLRTRGHDQSRLRDAEGILFTVARMNLRFLRPALFDDLLEVTLRIDSVRGARIVATQSIRRDAEVLLDAAVDLACIDAATLKPRRIPPSIVPGTEHAT